jgi:hypothetical protein
MKNRVEVLQDALNEVAATGETQLTIFPLSHGEYLLGPTRDNSERYTETLMVQDVVGIVSDLLGADRATKLYADFQATDYTDFMEKR